MDEGAKSLRLTAMVKTQATAEEAFRLALNACFGLNCLRQHARGRRTLNTSFLKFEFQKTTLCEEKMLSTQQQGKLQTFHYL